MKLRIDGELGETYAETLCLLYFPGAKFPKHEPEGSDAPSVYFKLTENGGAVTATCELTADNVRTRGEFTLDTGAERERAVKLAAGRAMLEAGAAAFGYTPAWGILTGVRPSKVATSLLRRGLTATETERVLTGDYGITVNKARLAVSVAKTEAEIIASVEPDECALYVSIPFCPTRCAYCSFISYASKRLLSLIPEYLEALTDELNAVFDRVTADGKRVSAVYIGGGTPTVLTARQLDGLLAAIGSRIDAGTLREYTLEGGRPDTITEEKLAVAASHGVGRISVNPQTLSDRVLGVIGRGHTAEDFFRAYETVRASGIRRVNTDLIAGLPSDTEEDFKATADKIIALAPDNVTVHTFSVKNSADIKRGGGGYLLDGVTYGASAAGSVDYSFGALTGAGYRPYYMYRQKSTVDNLENVGYAIPGAEGYYNVVMMEELCDIYAAGAGAVGKKITRDGGKVVIKRIFNPKYPYEYLRQRNAGASEGEKD